MFLVLVCRQWPRMRIIRLLEHPLAGAGSCDGPWPSTRNHPGTAGDGFPWRRAEPQPVLDYRRVRPHDVEPAGQGFPRSSHIATKPW